MPVHTRMLRQFIGDKNAHPIALNHLDSGAWRLPVVTPEVSLKTRRHFTHNGFGHKMKLFDTLIHPPR